MIEVRTPRLTLRPFQASDEPAVVAYKNDPDVARFQGWALPFTHELFIKLLDPAQRLAETGWSSRAICDSGGVCGDVGLRVHGQQAEFGISLASFAQGRGYAAEALAAITRHAFADLGIHRLHAGIDPANDGVKQLLTRARWRYEGTTIQSYWHRGTWTDDATYALLRDEWAATTEAALCSDERLAGGRTQIAHAPTPTVREMGLDEVNLRIDYFHDATDEHLRTLGVDRALLPSRTRWREFYEADYARPVTDRENFSLVWQLGDEIVGFSSTDQITFGEQAFMHLHILEPDRRRRGIGTQFVRLSAAAYFDALKLQRLYCQPNAYNVAPNRTLRNAGFRYMSTQDLAPSPINFMQPVTRWILDHPPV